jgi:hypothetical protein
MAMKGLGRIFDIGSAFTPVDFNTSDAATGHRVHLRNYGAIAFVLFKGAGTAGADPVITVQEHNANTGGTSQSLAVIDEYFYKAETTLDGDETWTRATQALGATASVDTWAEVELIAVVEVLAAQLSAGFEWVSCNIAATVANTQLVSGLYILHDLHIQRRPDLLAQPNA